MLKNAIARLQILEEDYNRREALVRTVINAEKQAKTNERIRFLLECKRASVYPKFITNSVRNISYVYKNSLVVEKRREAFCRQLLNESIKDAYRTQAFRLRECKRLQHEVTQQQQQWRQQLVDNLARQVYEEARRISGTTLNKKFRDLCHHSSVSEATTRGSELTAHSKHAEEDHENQHTRSKRYGRQSGEEADHADRLVPSDSDVRPPEEVWYDCQSEFSPTHVSRSSRSSESSHQVEEDNDNEPTTLGRLRQTEEADDADHLAPPVEDDRPPKETWYDCQSEVSHPG